MTKLAVEVLRCEPLGQRATVMLSALASAAMVAGVKVQQTTAYRGEAPWLVLWGPGAPDRADIMRRHVAAGGRAIVFDLSYWSRDRKVRVSIDAAHPQAFVMARDWPETRWKQDPATVGNLWKPHGPVVVAGIGEKAKAQYGADVVGAWESSITRACLEAGRKVLYRRKKSLGHAPAGATLASDGPIESVLRHASLLATWHSNVAVDAIRLGIPVVCQDGAAAAVSPSSLTPDHEPLPLSLRDRFLRNLAWFQWAPNEARGCWLFLQEVLA